MVSRGRIGLIVGILALLAGLFYMGARARISDNNPTKFSNNSQSPTGGWAQDNNGWRPVGTPPLCPDPLELASVVDVTKATSVLYPGQKRSVGYENTAGFRFDGLANEAIQVTAPMDGEIVQAARFLVSGEIQYVFDILSPCGIMNRFDHLLIIPSKLQAVADSLPAPKENDSRSTSISPSVKIIKGEVVATAIGLRRGKNTFLSWTVFDFRTKNRISQEPSWAAEHPALDHYAICPFPYLPSIDREIIKSLPPADYLSGSKSDFCD